MSEGKARVRASARSRRRRSSVSRTVVALSNQVRRAALCSQFLILGLDVSVAMRTCRRHKGAHRGCIQRMHGEGVLWRHRWGAEHAQSGCRGGAEGCRERACIGGTEEGGAEGL